MAKSVTLFTGQWADLPFEEVCRKASAWGYDSLEIACWGDHMDVRKAASDRTYAARKLQILKKYNLKGWALGAHLAGQCVGDLRRGWNFRSLGHGDVDFEAIIRELNAIGYGGPLSVEWEDNGMDREFGAKESLEFVRSMNFAPSTLAFDKDMKK